MSRDPDRLFVRNGRRAYRRRFSRTETFWGLAVLAALAGLGGWVAWKGARPDPALFAASAEVGAGAGALPLEAAPRPAPLLESGASAVVAGAPAPAAAERGPFPAGLAAPGWREGAIERFDPTNLYVKIDGREDYYKTFGFRSLHWVSLAAGDDPSRTVDLELFDLGTAANALGAYAGERPPEAAAQVGTSGMWHRARNASFATVGRYYLRLVGSDESAPVLQQVEQARQALTAALPGEPLPWGYALFVGGLGVDPGRVSYSAENAFSFGFAQRVYAARLDPALEDLEGFVVATAADGAAEQLAQQFARGFLEYGESAGEAAGVAWVRDRYLGTFAGAVPAGPWVVGVRGAPDAARGARVLADLRRATGGLAPDLAARARAEAAAPVPAGEASEGTLGDDGDSGDHGLAP